MCSEKRAVLPPGLGKTLIERSLQWEEDLSRFGHGVIDPVHGQQEDEEKSRANEDPRTRMSFGNRAKKGTSLTPTSAGKREKGCT